MRCNHCKRDLKESEFSPSRRNLKHPTCKSCEAKKEEKYRNNRILEEEREKDFDKYFGGYSIFILNTTLPNEHKYTIKNTDGTLFQTNDVYSFREKLKEIII